jgi:hypothetical protein
MSQQCDQAIGKIAHFEKSYPNSFQAKNFFIKTQFVIPEDTF